MLEIQRIWVFLAFFPIALRPICRFTQPPPPCARTPTLHVTHTHTHTVRPRPTPTPTPTHNACTHMSHTHAQACTCTRIACHTHMHTHRTHTHRMRPHASPTCTHHTHTSHACMRSFPFGFRLFLSAVISPYLNPVFTIMTFSRAKPLLNICQKTPISKHIPK